MDDLPSNILRYSILLHMYLNLTSRFTKILFVLLGGLLLCFQGFFNKYPLLYFDTGTYVMSGFSGKIPFDRPLTYGLFLRHISLSETLWLVIFAQGIIVSLLIYFFLKYFIKSKHLLFFHSSLCLFLVFFTGLSVNVSQLIPDIFALVFIMALGLLLLVNSLSKRDLWIIIFLTWLGIIMHNSHGLIAFGILFFISIYALWNRESGIQRKRIVMGWAIAFIGLFSIPSIHYIVGKEFVMSKGSHLFIMAHLVESGVVDLFLADNCDKKDYWLCEYQGKIPTELIWDLENSPVRKRWKGTDVWTKSKPEFDLMIKEIVTTPKYFFKLLIKSIPYTAEQFCNFHTGTTPQLGRKSPAYQFIKKKYSDEIRSLERSYQFGRQHWLKYDPINNRQLGLFFFSLSFFIAVLLVPSIRDNLSLTQKHLVFFVLIAMFSNAFICSNLSTIIPRYQSRIFCLYPIADFICLATLVSIFWKKYKPI